MEQSEARQDASRVQLHDCYRADDVRQECSEIAERPGHFAHVPRKAWTRQRRRLVLGFPHLYVGETRPPRHPDGVDGPGVRGLFSTDAHYARLLNRLLA